MSWYFWVLSAFGYLFVSGVTQRVSEELDRLDGKKVDDAPFGFLWPLILPWAVGEFLVIGAFKLMSPKPRHQLPEARINKEG